MTKNSKKIIYIVSAIAAIIIIGLGAYGAYHFFSKKGGEEEGDSQDKPSLPQNNNIKRRNSRDEQSDVEDHYSGKSYEGKLHKIPGSNDGSDMIDER